MSSKMIEALDEVRECGKAQARRDAAGWAKRRPMQWTLTPEIHAEQLERHAKILRERAEAMERQAEIQRSLTKVRR